MGQAEKYGGKFERPRRIFANGSAIELQTFRHKSTSSLVDPDNIRELDQNGVLSKRRESSHSLFGSLFLSLKFVISSARKRKRGWLIGWFAVFLVVFVLSLLFTAVSKSPTVFMRIAEDSIGEFDVVMSPDFPNFLDQNAIDNQLQNASSVRAFYPRWIMPVVVSKKHVPERTAKATILVTDSNREERFGLGRGWKKRALGEEEVHVSAETIDPLLVRDNRGDRVIIRFDPFELVQSYGLSRDFIAGPIEEAVRSALEQDPVVTTVTVRRENATFDPPGVTVEYSALDDLISQIVSDQNSSTIVDDIIEQSGRNLDEDPVIFNVTVDPNVTADIVVDALLAGLEVEGIVVDRVNSADGKYPEALGAIAEMDNHFLVELLQKAYLENLGALNVLNFANLSLPEFSYSSKNLSFTPQPRQDPAEVVNLVRNVATEVANETCSVNATSFVGVSNAGFCGTAKDENLVYNLTMSFYPIRRKRMAIRIGGKFDRGVIVLVGNGTWVSRVGEDLDWDGTWDSRDVVNAGLREFAAETLHTVTILGFSACCDEPITVQFQGEVGPWRNATEAELTDELRQTGTQLTTQLLLGSLGLEEQIVRETTNLFNLEESALASVGQYRNREETYLKSDDGIKSDLLYFTNDVVNNLGVSFPGNYSAPLYVALQATQFVKLFLDQILNSVSVIILLLGAVLIYSLLLSEQEERTYEFGMLRALGMKQTSLGQILVMHSMSFAIPGVGLGLLAAYLVNMPVTEMVEEFSQLSLSPALLPAGVIVCVVMGLVIPLGSSYIQIQRALSATLRDSLDVLHVVLSETKVRLQRLADLGLSATQTTVAVILVVVGFIVYYLVPYSFTFNNFVLFFAIMNATLLGMLLGLAVVTHAVQPRFERIMLHAVVLPQSDWRFKGLLKKNLSAHRKRNAKTALMLTCACAFVVFAGTMFALQSRSITDNLRRFSGAEITVTAADVDDPLDELGLTDFLNAQRADGRVRAFTFTTFSLESFPPVRDVRLSNLALFHSAWTTDVWGVYPDFLDAALEEFYVNSETSSKFSYPTTPSGESDAFRTLTHPDGITARPPRVTSGLAGQNSTTYTVVDDSLAVLVPEFARYWFGVSVDTPMALTIKSDFNPALAAEGSSTDLEARVDYMCRARAMVRKCPGFWFSSYPQGIFAGTTVLVHIDAMKELVEYVYTKAGNASAIPERVPQERAFVALAPGISELDRSVVVEGLKAFLSRKESSEHSVTDTQELVDSTDQATALLTVFFTIVAAISFVLSFFILWLSFSANIRENQWEFAVLRALGVSQSQLTRVYIYEALTVVFTSVVSGVVVGLVVSSTLTLQFNLFSELPFRFEFPTPLFAVIFSMSIVTAIVGSYIPVDALGKIKIASLLKASS